MDNTSNVALKKVNFIDYYSQICSNEIEYFVMEAKYTTFFNNSIFKLINELKREGKKDIELSINFTNEKELVSLDSEIVGYFMGDLFLAKFCNCCSKTEMNKLIQNVKIGNYETKKDFCNKMFIITYSTLREIYDYIVFRKKVFEKMCNELNIKNYNECDKAIYVLSMAIIENVMGYLQIKREEITSITNMFKKSYSFLTTI